MNEARRLAKERMQKVASTATAELVPLLDQTEEREVVGADGRRYRLKTYAFWDTEPWESDLYIRTKVTGGGPFNRYYGVETRVPENDFAPYEAPVTVSPTWTEMLAWVLFVAFLLAVVAGVVLLVLLI